MKTVRWGMIGCGDVTERKSGPGFGKAAHSELVAVMRRNGALAADYARRHGVARWHDDADAIIRAPDIDAIYIATLTDSHRDYTLRCAAAGKPVYVEKPMGMNHAECLDMLAACRAAGVPLWVGYYRRALPRFLAVRDLIAADAVGEVRMVTSRQLQRLPSVDQFAAGAVPWRVNPALSGGGLFFEGACHTFDFLDFMFGPVAEVRAFAGNQAGAYRPEDIVTATYRFASGVFGSGVWCYTADFDEEYNEIVGANGRIRFSTTQPVPIRIFRGDFMEELPVADPDHVHQPLIQTIVDELNGSGKCPSTGESAARTAHVMEAILADLCTQPAV
ncbi:MAG: Gfo/Idh/MocA family oxidoreductase [Burkholderiales bacterium]